MLRRIIQIDNEKCNGCGICASACHEGAIGIENGKAKLLREDYCDGLGDCLPACPEGAISFEEREALPYNEQAVMSAKNQNLYKNSEYLPETQLSNWPCQIKLVAANAAYFKNADLLIAADCTAFACAHVHERYMKGRVTLIGCPKLDNIDYSEKLTEIIKNNEIKSVTVMRMSVPCCRGIESAALKALEKSGRNIPFTTVVIERQPPQGSRQ